MRNGYAFLTKTIAAREPSLTCRRVFVFCIGLLLLSPTACRTFTRRLLGRRLGWSLGFLSAANQRESVSSAERIPPLRELFRYSRRLQFEINTPVSSQNNRSHVPGQSLLLVSCQRRIVFHRLFHFIGRELMLLAQCPCFNVVSRNAPLNQEALHACCTPFCQLLVVFLTATRISVGFKHQLGIRFDRKVFLEVVRDPRQRILLALDQPAVWIPRRRLSRSKVDAAQHQARRRLRWLHHWLRIHRK